MFWLYSPRPPQDPRRVLSFLWRVSCTECYGAGWFCELVEGSEYDYNERYCSCEASRWRRIADGWTDEQIGEWYATELARLEPS